MYIYACMFCIYIACKIICPNRSLCLVCAQSTKVTNMYNYLKKLNKRRKCLLEEIWYLHALIEI